MKGSIPAAIKPHVTMQALADISRKLVADAEGEMREADKKGG